MPMALHPNGINHLAISTCDMKAQLTFFAEVFERAMARWLA